MPPNTRLNSNGVELSGLAQSLGQYVNNGLTNRDNIQLLMNSYTQGDDTSTYVLNLNNANSAVTNEALFKQEQLMLLENNNISNQYKELENIQYNILNKNSLIKNTGAEVDEKNIQINILLTIIFFSFLFLIIIYLFGSNKISSTLLLISFGVLLIIYILLLLYYFNIGYFRLFIYNFYNVKGFKYDQKLKNWVDEMDNNLKLLKSDDTHNNCDCPKKETPLNKIIYISEEDDNEEENREREYNYMTVTNNDYSYHDDSSPLQTINPFPNPSMKNKIEWIDYDTTDNSNTYYGGSNSNQPTSYLSNDNTYTKNM
jgi:hypothetical protein